MHSAKHRSRSASPFAAAFDYKKKGEEAKHKRLVYLCKNIDKLQTDAFIKNDNGRIVSAKKHKAGKSPSAKQLAAQKKFVESYAVQGAKSPKASPKAKKSHKGAKGPKASPGAGKLCNCKTIAGGQCQNHPLAGKKHCMTHSGPKDGCKKKFKSSPKGAKKSPKGGAAKKK